MIALTRPVTPSIVHCQLTHLERQPIDPGRAAEQHRAYEDVLADLGCRIERVPPAHDHPDAVFVEDTAVVTDEVAIVTRPGARSRRGEVGPVADVLQAYRPLRHVEGPATLDGGDVLRLGRTVWVGLSARTNQAGFDQLRQILDPLGYELLPVPVTACLHLKTAVTALDPDTLLLNPAWVDPDTFRGYRVATVDPAEPFAANVLAVGDTIVLPAAHARTAERVAGLGFSVTPVDLSELEKAEGGVTCCSILLAP